MARALRPVSCVVELFTVPQTVRHVHQPHQESVVQDYRDKLDAKDPSVSGINQRYSATVLYSAKVFVPSHYGHAKHL